MPNPRMIRVVPNDYSPSMYTQPEELVDSVKYVKFADKESIMDVIHTEPIVNQTYIRSPYDGNQYFEIETYESDAWASKIAIIADIARCLGATDARFEMRMGTKRARNLDFQANGGNSVGSASVDFSKQEQDDIQAMIKNVLRFSPQACMPSPKEYKQAVKIAKEHNLYYDQQVQGMLKTRNPNDIVTNKLSEWSLHISLCSETNRDLKLAAKLGAPSLGLSIDSDFAKAVKYEKSIQVDVSFSFSLLPTGTVFPTELSAPVVNTISEQPVPQLEDLVPPSIEQSL